MASLIESVGLGLLGSDAMSMRIAGTRLSDQFRIWSGQPVKDRVPYDQSLLGFAEDKVLRVLPPSLRYFAKREIDMLAWEGIQKLKGFIGQAKDEFKGAAAGALSNSGVNDENLAKLGLVKKPSEQAHLVWTKDEATQDPSGFTGYKVQMYKGSEIKLTSSDRSNEIANTELDNILKFQPREDTLWYLTINRFDTTNGNRFNSALPEIPSFRAEFSDNTIEYLKWLPALGYRYNRRQAVTGSPVDYGWGGSFSQISSILRGNSFSITLQDDIHHNFSKYAKEVMNRSACYEDASMTYWECLIHIISLNILDRQWRVKERFNLLGILTSDGANSYSPDMDGNITYEFVIVGELSGGKNRIIETLDDDKIVQQTPLPMPDSTEVTNQTE